MEILLYHPSLVKVKKLPFKSYKDTQIFEMKKQAQLKQKDKKTKLTEETKIRINLFEHL